MAVITDEAHTAFGKQAAHDVRQILTDSNELRETVAEFGIEKRREISQAGRAHRV